MVSYIVHQKSSETSVIRHRDSPIFRAFAGLYSRALELTHIHATSPAQDDPQRHIPFTPITLYLRGSWFVLVLCWFSSCSRQLSASPVNSIDFQTPFARAHSHFAALEDVRGRRRHALYENMSNRYTRCNGTTYWYDPVVCISYNELASLFAP